MAQPAIRSSSGRIDALRELARPSFQELLQPGIEEIERLMRVVAPKDDGTDLVRPQVLAGCRAALERVGGKRLTMLGVVSAVRGEGRTTVAMGLAVAQHADHARRTILLELDLTNPSLGERLGGRGAPGIADIATGMADVPDCLQRLADGLWLIPAGTTEGGAPRLLNAIETSATLQRLLHWCDTIVADLPPLLGDAYGLGAAQLFPTTVLVSRAGATPMPVVRDAVKLLDSPPLVILNATSTRIPRWLRRVAGDWS